MTVNIMIENLKRYKKILVIAMIFISLFGLFFLDKQINNFKDIDNQSTEIRSLTSIESFDLIRASPNEFPIRLGALNKNSKAYFLVDFKFTGKYVQGYENLFQTASANSGIRLEQHGQSLALIIFNSGKSKYSALEITNELSQDKVHHIKIEALTNEFLRIYFDGKEIKIQSPEVSFSTEEFLIGSGFDIQRKYSNDLMNISFKKTNYYSKIGSFLKYYPTGLTNGGFLTIVAKGGIFLILIFLPLFKLSKKQFVKPNLAPRQFIFLMLACQAILIFYYPNYRYSIVVYGFLFIVGFYPIRFLALTHLKIDEYIWLFSPLMGLIVISLLGAFAITFNFVMAELIYFLVLFIIFISTVQFFKIFKGEVHSLKSILVSIKTQSYIQSILIYSTFLIAPLVLVLTMASIYIDDLGKVLLSTPIRVGPDAALYARMAQYLLDGGSWQFANLEIPKYENMTIGEITRYTNLTMDWPFLFFYRWGLVSFQTMNVVLNSLDHIYRVAFTSMVIPHLLTGGIIFYWLREEFFLSRNISIAGAIGIIFNVNLLNIWFEGFYGNTYSLCLYTFFYLLVAQLRNCNIQFSKDTFNQHFLVSLVISSILVSYGEGLLFVFIPLMSVYFLINLLVERTFNIQIYRYLISCLFVAIVLTLPCQFIYDWALLSIKQITEEGGNGYSQPYWATINEVLGINNIYDHIYQSNNIFSNVFDGKAHNRSKWSYFLAVISSILICLLLLFNLINDKNKYRSNLNISAYLLILIFVILYYAVSPLNNYGYMKMYIFLLPLLFVYFIKACAFLEHYLRSLNLYMLKKIQIVAAMSCVMVLNGLSYIVTYNSTSTLIKPSYLLNYSQMRNLDISDKVFFPVVDNKFITIFPAMINPSWITRGWYDIEIESIKYFQDLLNKKIFLFIEKNSCLMLPISGVNIFYEDQNFIIIDTNLSVISQLINGKFSDKSLKIIMASFKNSNCR